MANVKITDLTAYTDAASTDVLPVVDVTNDVTKKISISNLLKAAPLGSAAAPGIAIDGDPDTGVFSAGSNQIGLATNGAGRLFITSAGLVGIGTTAPTAPLSFSSSVGQKIDLYSGAAGNEFGFGIEANELRVCSGTGSSIGFRTGGYSGSERARIDSSGRLLVGTSTARTNLFNTSVASNILQVEKAADSAGISIVTNNDAGSTAYLVLCRSRGTSIGSNTLVASGDVLGTLTFQGSDGAEFVDGARIEAFVDGTSGANDMPGRLVFSTTADGASSPTERMRITNDGSISTKTTPTSLSDAGTTIFGASSIAPNAVNITRSAGYVLAINRTTDDGTLIEFYQDTTLEGTISVSGTTVSYNGAHLSRWSQLPSGAERIEILRGTVLSNVDEMCEWIDEDNEQLNCMQVSDVEGDPNVSGVFQAWDDDDNTYNNDFYCAMTGDFIIRIAGGVMVQRGDLLMSAGDGTAKPQGDDIIRSKTVAKVTSTNVSCTYEDGSYCVPCVLMAC